MYLISSTIIPHPLQRTSWTGVSYAYHGADEFSLAKHPQHKSWSGTYQVRVRDRVHRSHLSAKCTSCPQNSSSTMHEIAAHSLHRLSHDHPFPHLIFCMTSQVVTEAICSGNCAMHSHSTCRQSFLLLGSIRPISNICNEILTFDPSANQTVRRLFRSLTPSLNCLRPGPCFS